jgi:hypothetical protein
LSQKKETARRMLLAKEGKTQLESADIIDRYADHRSRPLPEHLDDFDAELRSRGNTPKHVRGTVQRVRDLLAGCGFTLAADLDAGKERSGWRSSVAGRPPTCPRPRRSGRGRNWPRSWVAASRASRT